MPFACLAVAGGELHVMRRHRMAQVARAGVDYDPHLAAFVLADLGKVVSAAKRVQIRHALAIENPLQGIGARQRFTGNPLRNLCVVRKAHRHVAVDRIENFLRLVADRIRIERCFHCDHSAADIEADPRGDHDAFRGYHGADRQAVAGMRVRHERALDGPRLGQCIEELRKGFPIDVVRVDFVLLHVVLQKP